MGKIMHIENDNGGWFREATIRISTISLPQSTKTSKTLYETCLFSGGHSEVIKLHTSLREAVAFHQDLAEEMGLL